MHGIQYITAVHAKEWVPFVQNYYQVPLENCLKKIILVIPKNAESDHTVTVNATCN